MAALLYHVFSFAALFSYGLYHLVSASRAHLKSQQHRDYAARPYHPLPLPPHGHHVLRHLPIYLVLLALVLAALNQVLIASSAAPDPLLRGRTPVHRLAALQSTVIILLFLSLLPLSSSPTPLSCVLRSPDDLPAKCDAVASTVAAASSALCLSLAVFPRLFVAELALAASVSLQGLWSLQTGLSLYAEAFIPEGCHRLIDVAAGIEGSTKCELEESRLRAAALLDLAFVMHTIFVAAVAVLIYAAVARAVGVGPGSLRKMGSYEVLPTGSSGGALNDMDQVQMKVIGKNAMQA
ncbi:unnamed protein product [Spirodela intermedia]|uniref:Uncharacterized protein n=1 Tax=Spirodela intermedia TaxID=51605 RepID=A0A7I8J259_SPIIN|nr:unnamed protein product [Spirodela intermedia]CAA6664149.1 unnamed protein product [Spirodela intermedia]